MLDVACGPGLMACAFAQRARRVTGIDLTPAMIEQAKKFQQAQGLANLTWHIGDVLPLPFADASFSVVFTRLSFHHFLDPKAVLTEMVRVCSPGGRVMVVDMFTRDPDQAEAFNRMEKLCDPSHVRALSLDELSGLFANAGFPHPAMHFYQHEVELEQILQRSFPNPGDAEKVRRMVIEDVGVNRLGVEVSGRQGSIYYAYPVVIAVENVSGKGNDLVREAIPSEVAWG